jgi:hypothetical protein
LLVLLYVSELLNPSQKRRERATHASQQSRPKDTKNLRAAVGGAVVRRPSSAAHTRGLGAASPILASVTSSVASSPVTSSSVADQQPNSHPGPAAAAAAQSQLTPLERGLHLSAAQRAAKKRAMRKRAFGAPMVNSSAGQAVRDKYKELAECQTLTAHILELCAKEYQRCLPPPTDSSAAAPEPEPEVSSTPEPEPEGPTWEER